MIRGEAQRRAIVLNRLVALHLRERTERAGNGAEEPRIRIRDPVCLRISLAADRIVQLRAVLRQRRRRNLIEYGKFADPQAGALVADVSDIEYGVFHDFTLDIQIPLLHVRREAVVGIEHRRAVLVSPRDVVTGPGITIGREAGIPVEDTRPRSHRIGVERIGAAGLHIRRLAVGCCVRSRSSVKYIALVEDSVGSAEYDFGGPVPGETKARAEIFVISSAEIALACAARAVTCEIVSAAQPG